MRRSQQFTTFSACLCLGLAVSAQADVVTDWNAIALQTIGSAAPPRPPGSPVFLDIAMVHLAIHDAIAAIDGQHVMYGRPIPGAAGSPVAAAAKAARDVLANRFPGQTASLDLAYNNYLSANGLAPNSPGVAVGQQAAAGIIAMRVNDGSYPVPDPPFVGGTGIGVWRPTPPALSAMAAPWMGNVRPFALNHPSQFLPKPPPALTSGLYTRDYEQVKEFGSVNSTRRTAEQTDLAHFWNANYLILWNQVTRDLVNAHVSNIGRSARLFALVNMAMADAGITSWNTKNRYVLWRPITAIQNGDNDGNSRTLGDPAWQPLVTTPPYPDYTSGANNVTGAATTILRRFFGRDWISFNVTTTNTTAVRRTRSYHRLSEAADEVVLARVFEGIHFLFADTEGRSQGRSVARWAFKRYLRPVSDSGDDDDDDDERR